METDIATTLTGKLAYMVAVVDPRNGDPTRRECWLSKEANYACEPTDDHEPFITPYFVREARYEAEDFMRKLANARFDQPKMVDISGFLHRKMCLIGQISHANGNGLSMHFHSGVKLRLYRVMICRQGMLRIKEQTGYEVALEWLKPESEEKDYVIAS